MQVTYLERFGNQEKENIDILIYIPHASINKTYLPFIRETSLVNLSNISDEILYKYLYHEADTGMLEVARAMCQDFFSKNFHNNFSLAILWVDIPRGFCDLNRSPDIAIPKTFVQEKWLLLYRQAEIEINTIFSRAHSVLHLHSMNGFNPIYKANFDSALAEGNIAKIFTEMYSGTKRECTILTENTDREYLTDKNFDVIIKNTFKEEGIALEENTAYRFVDTFPCTDLVKKYPSSFVEITKNALATKETSGKVDSNEIIFDEEKIQEFGKIFSKIFHKYLMS